MEKTKILLVADDENIWKQIRWGLSNDYDVLSVRHNEALSLIVRMTPPLVLFDLPDSPNGAGAGMNAIQSILLSNPMTKIIVVTDNVDRGNAILAFHNGVFDYFEQPIDMEEFKGAIKRAAYRHQLEREEPTFKPAELDGRFGQIVTQCKVMRNVLSILGKVSGSNAPVLITGESGTGKELLARSIHMQSPRKDMPFITIACGGASEDFLDQELFGTEKGHHKWTRVDGRMGNAHGGTLFFDEIDMLSPTLQVKLNQFLQAHQIKRSADKKYDDVCIIAATTVDMKKAGLSIILCKWFFGFHSAGILSPNMMEN